MCLLCTGGGDNSITLTEEFLSSSRRQRIKAFKACLEAEYAERPGHGTKARLEVVLSLLLIHLHLRRENELTRSSLSLYSCSSEMVGISL